MTTKFKTIGLIARLRSPENTQPLKEIQDFLHAKNYKIVLEEDTAKLFSIQQYPVYSREEFGKHCDLAIVIGGDGSMLNAARAVVDHKTPVLGINRGRLGFLTDIHPQELEQRISEVLAGKYIEETRFLLHAEIIQKNKAAIKDIALNDVVLLPGDYAHMIEFEIYINNELVCSQRADGQIIATPTGSTAYALSGGGPILHPKLNAVVLVPMFSHTLSARPIVVDSDSIIELVVAESNETSPRVSCDGQERIAIAPGSRLRITKKKEPLILLHPPGYNYFDTLRTKLHWHKKL